MNLKVKVTDIGEITKQIVRSGQQLDKCVVSLSDHSGSNHVQFGTKILVIFHYRNLIKICDASVRRHYGNTPTTFPTTTIEEIPDIGIAKYTEQESDTREHKISISSVLCTEITRYPICRKDIGDYNKDLPLFKCPHCKMRQKTVNVVAIYKCEIMTKINGETKRLYISNSALKNFPRTKNCVTCDEIEDVLITIQDVTILFQQNSCQVLSIKNENIQQTEDAEAEEVQV